MKYHESVSYSKIYLYPYIQVLFSKFVLVSVQNPGIALRTYTCDFRNNANNIGIKEHYDICKQKIDQPALPRSLIKLPCLDEQFIHPKNLRVKSGDFWCVCAYGLGRTKFHKS